MDLFAEQVISKPIHVSQHVGRRTRWHRSSWEELSVSSTRLLGMFSCKRVNPLSIQTPLCSILPM